MKSKLYPKVTIDNEELMAIGSQSFCSEYKKKGYALYIGNGCGRYVDTWAYVRVGGVRNSFRRKYISFLTYPKEDIDSSSLEERIGLFADLFGEDC